MHVEIVITSSIYVVGLEVEYETLKSLSYIEKNQKLTLKTENSRSHNVSMLFRNMEVRNVASQDAKCWSRAILRSAVSNYKPIVL